MKLLNTLLVTLTLLAVHASAQAPAAPAGENILAGLAEKLDLNSRKPVPLPPDAKKLEISVTISLPEYKAPPLSGAEAGVWVQFLNAENNPLSPQGADMSQRKTTAGFGMGVSRRTTKPVTRKKIVAVPPGATQIQVILTEYWSRGLVGAWNEPKLEALSAVVVP
jgi:hypothetical protein